MSPPQTVKTRDSGPVTSPSSTPWIHVVHSDIASPCFTRLGFQLRLSSRDPQDAAKRARPTRFIWLGFYELWALTTSANHAVQWCFSRLPLQQPLSVPALRLHVVGRSLSGCVVLQRSGLIKPLLLWSLLSFRELFSPLFSGVRTPPRLLESIDCAITRLS